MEDKSSKKPPKHFWTSSTPTIFTQNHVHMMLNVLYRMSKVVEYWL